MSLRRVQRNWERLAVADPLWAILSDPERRNNRWDPEEFFRTGRDEIEAVLGYVDRIGLPLRRGRALDFGCGVGRLTQALASRFEEVHGVDVAPSMIDHARRHNRHGDRCHYRVNDSPGLPYEPSWFDFAYSNLTLQHMPARLAAGYIREFVRVLAPGGVLIFQEAADPVPLPGALRPWGRLKSRLRRALPRPLVVALRACRLAVRPPATFEMHGIPRPEVEDLIARAGGRLADVVEDRSAGAGWTSFRYCVIRPTPSAG